MSENGKIRPRRGNSANFSRTKDPSRIDFSTASCYLETIYLSSFSVAIDVCLLMSSWQPDIRAKTLRAPFHLPIMPLSVNETEKPRHDRDIMPLIRKPHYHQTVDSIKWHTVVNDLLLFQNHSRWTLWAPSPEKPDLPQIMLLRRRKKNYSYSVPSIQEVVLKDLVGKNKCQDLQVLKKIIASVESLNKSKSTESKAIIGVGLLCQNHYI